MQLAEFHSKSTD